MTIVGSVLTFVASIAALVFGIQILIVAFKKSIGWGLASLLIPFVIFVFVFMNWSETKTPFIRMVIALVVEFIGVGVLVGGGLMSSMSAAH